MSTLQQLRKHQGELFLFTLVLLIVAVVTTVVLTTAQGEQLLAASLGILSVLFCIYVVQKESAIRSLSQRLQQEALAALEAQARETVLNTKIKELVTLHSALVALTTEQRPEKALETILASALGMSGASRGSIMLVDESKRRFVIAASQGLKREYLDQVQEIGDGVAGSVVASGRPMLMNGTAEASGYANYIAKETAIRSSLCVPLRLRQTVIGVLNCSSVGPEGREFTQYDLELMCLLANYASLVLERAQATATPLSSPR